MMKVFVLGVLLLFFLSRCEMTPQEINYGEDACYYCKMTIIDKQHVALCMTKKGKTYKFDAIECMLNHIKNWQGVPIKNHLVANYIVPGELIDATQAYFLIAEEIPSPMGANLSAFKGLKQMDSIFHKKEGREYDWKTLQELTFKNR